MRGGEDLYSGRTALVTGGSSGIGRAVALKFAELGGQVLITGRRQAALEEVTAMNSAIHLLRADVADVTAPTRALDAVNRLWGRLDLLVNNAGAFSVQPPGQTGTEEMRRLFEVNVIAPTRLFEVFLPLLEEAEGTVVNVSSTFGSRPAPQAPIYGASKAALEHLTRSWALAVASRGIRVNAVAPGPTETGILSSSGLSPAEVEGIQKAEAKAIPLGRRGDPDEVAQWILNLVGPEATWITGQVIGVDGGMGAA